MEIPKDASFRATRLASPGRCVAFRTRAAICLGGSNRAVAAPCVCAGAALRSANATIDMAINAGHRERRHEARASVIISEPTLDLGS